MNHKKWTVLGVGIVMSLSTGCAALASATGGDGQTQEITEEEREALYQLGGEELVEDAEYFTSIPVSDGAGRDDPNRLATSCFSQYLEGLIDRQEGMEEFEARHEEESDPNVLDLGQNQHFQQAEYRFSQCETQCTQARDNGFESPEILERYSQRCQREHEKTEGFKHLWVAEREVEAMEQADNPFTLASQHRGLQSSDNYGVALEKLGEDHDDMADLQMRYESLMDTYGDFLDEIEAFRQRDDIQEISEEQAFYREIKADAEQYLLNTDQHDAGVREIDNADEQLERLRKQYRQKAEEEGLYQRFEELRKQ